MHHTDAMAAAIAALACHFLPMKSIPRFALYGTQGQPDWIDLVHFERIPDRARLFDWEISPHVHDALIQVLVPRKGGGSVLIDGAAWALRPPCVVVVPARCVHGFRFTPGTDGAVVTAAQRPLEAVAKVVAPELLDTIRRPAVVRIDPNGRHAKALRPLVDAIERESATHAPGQAAAGVPLLVALFVQIARLGGGGAGEGCDGGRGGGDSSADGCATRARTDDRVLRFQTLLDAQFRAQRAVGHYAQAVGVTAGQLTRLCHEGLGMSTLAAINARVVHEAQRELAYSSLSIKQIAAELGFDDDAYFGRFFKKQTGHRPTEFRELARRRLAAAHGGAGPGHRSAQAVVSPEGYP